MGESQYSSSAKQDDDDDRQDFTSQMMILPTLRDWLDGQLRLMPISERDQALVRLLIDELNSDGYLPVSFEELELELPSDWDIQTEEWQMALNLLQQMEPAGVGARDVAECLSLQLDNLSESIPFWPLAKKLSKIIWIFWHPKTTTKLRKF